MGNFNTFCHSLIFFFKINFSKKFFQKHHQSVKQLDSSQTRHFVGPDRGPNCLKRLSADDTRRCVKCTNKLIPDQNLSLSFLATFVVCLITFANSLDPDQDRHKVGPDLNLYCLTF